MSKRRYRVALAATMSIAMLATAACGSDDGAGSSGDNSSNGSGGGDVTLTMWTFLDPDAGTDGRSAALKSMIDNFESENDGVTIEVQTRDWATLTSSYLAAAAAGNEPDITWMPTNDYWSVVGQGALADISDTYESSTDPLTGSLIDGMKKDDELYGVPISMGAYGILYRKDLLEEAGVEEAQLETWDGFEQAVGALTDGDKVYGFGQAFSTTTADIQVMAPRLLQTEGSLFTDDGDPTWATDNGVAALEYQLGFVQNGFTSDAAVQWTSEDTYEQYVAGRAAIVPALSTRVPVMNEQLGEEIVGFALWPQGAGSQDGNLVAGWTVGVSAESDHADVAANFVGSLVSTQADEEWVTTGGQAPLREETLQAIDDAPQYLVTVIEAMKTGWIPPPAAVHGDYRVYLNEAAQNALVKGMDAREALEAAQEQYEEGK